MAFLYRDISSAWIWAIFGTWPACRDPSRLDSSLPSVIHRLNPRVDLEHGADPGGGVAT